MTKTLRDQLTDWVDVDVAEYHLACALGLITPDVEFATRAKHVFWSANPVGDVLHRMLEQLVSVGALECDEELRYRWSQSYRGTWET
jgi:hypothetical protein